MLLTLFPQLLFLAPLGTTILRIAAAICFAYMARHFWMKKQELSSVEVPIVGHLSLWMIALSDAIVSVIAIFLFFGVWTQVVALLGALTVVKQLIFFRRYSAVFPFEKSTYWLLLCICLMLFVTGAGAFSLSFYGTSIPTAVDLPL
jgi:uncharacterized membrane protein YphA (DoxX/SURF4 family)